MLCVLEFFGVFTQYRPVFLFAKSLCVADKAIQIDFLFLPSSTCLSEAPSYLLDETGKKAILVKIFLHKSAAVSLASIGIHC